MGKGSTQTSTQSTRPPREVMEQYRKVTSRAEDVAGTPFTPFTGQRVAGLSPDQIASGQYIRDLAGEHVRPLHEVVGDYFSPYQDRVVDATMANLNEVFGQQYQRQVGNSISKDAWGGDRAGIATAELARQQGLAAGETIGGLQHRGYNEALQTAAADMERMRNARLGNAQALFGYGAADQATTQDELNAIYEAYQKQQAYPFETTQWWANIAGGLGPSMGSTSTSTQPGPSTLSQVAGGGLSLLGLFKMLSDEREKESITPVGKLKNGQTVYRYRFKGDPTWQIGLLAQEVEEDHPEAVSEHGGRKYVDYGRATRASGGSVPGRGVMFLPSYVPRGEVARGAGLAAPSMPSAPKPETLADQVTKFTEMFKGVRGGSASKTSPGGMEVGGTYAVPDLSGATADPSQLFGLYSHGGGVAGRRSYQTGGGPIGPGIGLDMEDMPSAGMVPLPDMGPFGGGASPSSGLMPIGPTALPLPPNTPPRRPAEPGPTMLAEGDEEDLPTGAMPAQGRNRDQDIGMSLLAAGLGIMGGTSPHAGVNIGQGGLQGINAWRGLQSDRRADELNEIRKVQIAESARRLRESAATTARRLKIVEDRNAQGSWKFVGSTPDGKGSIWLNSRTGEKKIEDIAVAPKGVQSAGQLLAGDRKAIREAMDKSEGADIVMGSLKEALDLNKKAMSGPFASQRGWLWSQFEGDEGGAGTATQSLENTIQQTTLPQLKLIFGGNPTEGERKILLDMAGAAKQAPQVREEIFRRAMKLAERRKQYYREQADDIKSGKYYKPGETVRELTDEDDEDD